MENRVGLMGLTLLIIVGAAALLVGTTAADTHIVGSSLQWTVPPGGEIAYRTWAAGEHFQINDTVVFQWNSTHTVARVSRGDYDNCTSANLIGQVQTVSPVNFTLDSDGPHYFICTVASHCSLGQKVTITVGSSSASYLSGASLSAVLVILTVAFLTLM